MPKELLEL